MSGRILPVSPGEPDAGSDAALLLGSAAVVRHRGVVFDGGDAESLGDEAGDG